MPNETPFPTGQRRDRLTVAMLTSVGDRCGIAAYARGLVPALSELADVTVEPVEVGRQPLEHYQAQAERLNRADVVHIQHEHSFWGGVMPGHSAFWNLRYMLEKPVVVTAHTTTRLRDLLRTDAERRPAHRIAKELLLLRRGYRDSVETAPFITGRCIVHTAEAARELAERGANPKYLHIIPAGIPDVQPAPNAFGGRAFRERFGLGERRVVSLFGYVAPNKGYELALEALPGLPADVALVIAGGARNAEMEAYAASVRAMVAARGLVERVVVTGYLTEPDVAEAMAASDIVIAPHTAATGSYSITIPLAHGRPVVASDLACFREIHEASAPSPCLALFRAGDSADFQRVLGDLLADDARRAELARRARDYAWAHSWAEAARRTVAVYREAIADVERLGHVHHGAAR